MTSLETLIAQLKEAAAKATPGRWRFGLDKPSHGYLHANKLILGEKIYVADGEYIALCSPENILALCEALDEARELLQGLTEFHPDSCAYFQGSECDCFLGAKHQQAGQKARAWLKKYGSSN